MNNDINIEMQNSTKLAAICFNMTEGEFKYTILYFTCLYSKVPVPVNVALSQQCLVNTV